MYYCMSGCTSAGNHGNKLPVSQEYGHINRFTCSFTPPVLSDMSEMLIYVDHINKTVISCTEREREGDQNFLRRERGDS